MHVTLRGRVDDLLLPAGQVVDCLPTTLGEVVDSQVGPEEFALGGELAFNIHSK